MVNGGWRAGTDLKISPRVEQHAKHSTDPMGRVEAGIQRGDLATITLLKQELLVLADHLIAEIVCQENVAQ